MDATGDRIGLKGLDISAQAVPAWADMFGPRWGESDRTVSRGSMLRDIVSPMIDGHVRDGMSVSGATHRVASEVVHPDGPQLSGDSLDALVNRWLQNLQPIAATIQVGPIKRPYEPAINARTPAASRIGGNTQHNSDVKFVDMDSHRPVKV